MVRKCALFLVVIGILVTGCSQATLQATATIRSTEALTPFHTLTPTAAKPSATIVVTIPVTPSPTPTPFLHTITNDDTMLGLAFRYGVKLEDLKTANPNVNPNAMTVGSQLIIPISGEISEVMSTPTAVPVKAGQPACYGTADGGAWCVIAVHNDLDVSLENLSAWVGLYSSGGEMTANQVAYAPMNILRPGSTMPLMAHFSAPLPAEYGARSEMLSVYTIAANDARYLDAEAKADQVEINPQGSQAVVSGKVLLSSGSAKPTQVWVLVVAYDAQGNILGARKWKSAGDTSFNTTVYSLGGIIDHIELLCEVRK